MNRLARESSPYLLQHQDNPVDWHSWNVEALEQARAQDKPIFLSIGYSACHWCHVMEHESFENASIAALLNRHFVCIKVDREERPDLDHIYMQAVQMITGRGGWPLSVFLTPELKPFYGGTYWPPAARLGMPGFDQVLVAVVDTWNNRRGRAIQQAAQLTAALQDVAQSASRSVDSKAVLPDAEIFKTVSDRFAATFDRVHGGFGRAPKFPRTIDLQVLLRAWLRDRQLSTLDMVVLTLDKMAAGGMYDHLAGGFARYSVDERWLVPHFEKMLYDNALLADVYLDGHLATGNSAYARIAAETLDYVLRDMLDDRGGFHGTEDADSEGEEGKFYVWTLDQVKQVLGKEAATRFCHVYNVTKHGNFEGKNVLHLPRTMARYACELGEDPDSLARELAAARGKLLRERDKRTRPAKDDKVLVSWNALMIHALARSAGILNRPDHLAAAQGAARFLLAELRRPDGRLLHCWRGGQAKLDAYLDDYVYLINSLVTLYEADFDEHWVETAIALSDTVIRHFLDRQHGGFYFTADDHETLIQRTKELADGSVPSGNAMAATALMRLGKLCGRQDFLQIAHTTLGTVSDAMKKTPEAFGQMLLAADLVLGPFREIVILGDPASQATGDVLDALRKTFLPRRVVACRDVSDRSFRSEALGPLFAGKTLADKTPVAYVCKDFTCQQPVRGPENIIETWRKLAGNAVPCFGGEAG